MNVSEGLSASLEDYLEAIFCIIAAKGVAHAKDIAKRLCKVEHSIPPPIVEKLVSFMEFVEICPRGGQQLVDGFRHYHKTGSKENCKRCIVSSLEKLKKGKSKTKGKANMTLAGLKPKQKAVVVRIERRGPISKRLADMGIGRGALLDVKRVAPLGDPIVVKVKGYNLSLRKEDAAGIIVSIV
jgi:DtxR family Mn-dependent transcriptional regulator